MKLFRVLVALLLIAFVMPAFAVLPPSYLSVNKWKRCAASYKKDTAEFICLPNRKPLDCPSRSWQQLTEMSNIPACPSVGNEEAGAVGPSAIGASAPR